MVNIRLLSIILGLLFVMHGSTDFPSALAQDEAPATYGLPASDRKGPLDDHDVMVGIGVRKLYWLQGRKMAAHLRWKEYEKETKGMDWKISGASRSDGTYDFEGRGDLYVKRKFDDKSSQRHKLNNVAADFVAFSSDYHGPKRHPPKHN